jgi:hypothetical protein
MPSVSGPQHRLMELVAHNAGAAKRLGIKQSVGKDFVQADIGKHFPSKTASARTAAASRRVKSKTLAHRA